MAAAAIEQAQWSSQATQPSSSQASAKVAANAIAQAQAAATMGAQGALTAAQQSAYATSYQQVDQYNKMFTISFIAAQLMWIFHVQQKGSFVFW